jgi:hypothetical protein
MRNPRSLFYNQNGAGSQPDNSEGAISGHSFMQHRTAGGTNRQEGMQNRTPARRINSDTAKP